MHFLSQDSWLLLKEPQTEIWRLSFVSDCICMLIKKGSCQTSSEIWIDVSGVCCSYISIPLLRSQLAGYICHRSIIGKCCLLIYVSGHSILSLLSIKPYDIMAHCWCCISFRSQLATYQGVTTEKLIFVISVCVFMCLSLHAQGNDGKWRLIYPLVVLAPGSQLSACHIVRIYSKHQNTELHSCMQNLMIVQVYKEICWWQKLLCNSDT